MLLIMVGSVLQPPPIKNAAENWWYSANNFMWIWKSWKLKFLQSYLWLYLLFMFTLQILFYWFKYFTHSILIQELDILMVHFLLGLKHFFVGLAVL